MIRYRNEPWRLRKAPSPMIKINNFPRQPGHAIEAFVGEELAIAPSPLSVRLPDGNVIGLESTTYTPTVSGWHTFATQVGSLRVLVFAPNVLDAIPEHTTGSAAPRTVADRRLVLRALAVDPDLRVNGGELCDVRACGDLRAYGA